MVRDLSEAREGDRTVLQLSLDVWGNNDYRYQVTYDNFFWVPEFWPWPSADAIQNARNFVTSLATPTIAKVTFSNGTITINPHPDASESKYALYDPHLNSWTGGEKIHVEQLSNPNSLKIIFDWQRIQHKNGTLFSTITFEPGMVRKEGVEGVKEWVKFSW